MTLNGKTSHLSLSDVVRTVMVSFKSYTVTITCYVTEFKSLTRATLIYNSAHWCFTHTKINFWVNLTSFPANLAWLPSCLTELISARWNRWRSDPLLDSLPQLQQGQRLTLTHGSTHVNIREVWSSISYHVLRLPFLVMDVLLYHNIHMSLARLLSFFFSFTVSGRSSVPGHTAASNRSPTFVTWHDHLK